ncbi:hypothetical protein PAECIP111891_06693 [Paenibacillus allorhizoplanae]|uniref:DUF3862 domain-containing protein n=1 Tax=Paenibacillus allorhizoplanae TaxID=2905648 RepID=A0ABN8HA75_9BACL|nr:DUF3862 domain-containing protein [Paenibacillus allorhizoplanae]CAH1230598.1 hypothetical protein PAECIP111891_06693 [Paenibacillus allorhizoplanae]
MKALKVLGWIIVPYVMIFAFWKKIGVAGKIFGTTWATLVALMVIGNMVGEKAADKQVTAPVVSVAASATPSVIEAKKEEASPTPTPKPATPTPVPTPKPTPKNKESISKEEFDAIKTGMTYDEVSKIIGGPGEVLSESGTKGGTGLDIHTVMYMYKGEGSLGANSNMMFQNEKLINKAQIGLK